MAISKSEPTSTAATRELWNAGDYSVVSSRLMIAAEDLCETADVRGGRQALDVACGDGNTALAMARRDLRVTAVDIVPALVERAQERARFEGLDIEFGVGNAEALDLKDNTFDVVVSSFGVPFAADQQAVASELLRVCRPGGRIALANWSPLDFWSELPGIQAKFAPPPPGAPSPMKWGSEEGLRELFGSSPSIAIHPRTFRYRFATVDRYLGALLPSYSPFVRLAERIGDEAFSAFAEELAQLVAKWNHADDGTLVLPMTYAVALIDTPS
jgi:ubiquinone/menaquinone biosynthesis C-methylase UbiE